MNYRIFLNGYRVSTYDDCIKLLIYSAEQSDYIVEIEGFENEYGDEIIYLDAMKSPIKRIQDKYRYQIMMRMKLAKADEIENRIFRIVDRASKTSVFFEVNPQNLS